MQIGFPEMCDVIDWSSFKSINQGNFAKVLSIDYAKIRFLAIFNQWRQTVREEPFNDVTTQRSEKNGVGFADIFIFLYYAVRV